MQGFSLKNIFLIVVPIVVVAVFGSIFVNFGIDWFASLQKPTQWIPNFVIPIVWTIVYVLFAVVLIVYTKEDNLPTKTTILLAINGILNVLWCLVFFALNQTLLGNVLILFNLAFGVLLLNDIFKLKQVFGWVLLVYPLWLLIATTLNLAVWILN